MLCPAPPRRTRWATSRVNHLSQVRISQGRWRSTTSSTRPRSRPSRRPSASTGTATGRSPAPSGSPCSSRSSPRSRRTCGSRVDGRAVRPRLPAGADPHLPARPGRSLADPGRGELRGRDPARRAPGRAPRRHVRRTGWAGRRSRSCRGRGPTSARAFRRATRPVACAPTRSTSSQSPPDQREASFAVSEGSGRVSAPDGEDVGPVTTDRAQDGFAGALTSGNDHGLLILLLLGSRLRLGRSPRALARARQDDGRGLPGREPRTAQGRGRCSA